MTIKNYGLSIGDYCRHKPNVNIGWAKILEIGYFGKTYKIAKCEWSMEKDASIGLITYFALKDLVI